MAKKDDGRIIVDFTGVESGGGRVRVPEDDYRFRVKAVKMTEAKSSGNPMVVWEMEIMDGPKKGKVIRDRSVLTRDSMWKLKSILEAMGLTVSSKRVALQLDKYIGKELAGTVVDDEYENKMYSTISDYFPVDMLNGDDVEDEDEDDEEEEDTPPPKKNKKAKKNKKVAVEDDEEEIEDLDLDSL